MLSRWQLLASDRHARVRRRVRSVSVGSTARSTVSGSGSGALDSSARQRVHDVPRRPGRSSVRAAAPTASASASNAASNGLPHAVIRSREASRYAYAVGRPSHLVGAGGEVSQPPAHGRRGCAQPIGDAAMPQPDAFG